MRAIELSEGCQFLPLSSFYLDSSKSAKGHNHGVACISLGSDLQVAQKSTTALDWSHSKWRFLDVEALKHVSIGDKHKDTLVLKSSLTFSKTYLVLFGDEVAGHQNSLDQK